MNTQRTGIIKRFSIMLIFAVIITAFTSISAQASQKVDIAEGTYYIKAVNGNAKGQVLYWNEKESDQNISMMFESCGGSHADNEVWYITKNRNFDDYYGIYLYKDYNGDKDRCKRIEIDNLTGRDQPYLTSTTGPHIFCGSFGNVSTQAAARTKHKRDFLEGFLSSMIIHTMPIATQYIRRFSLSVTASVRNAMQSMPYFIRPPLLICSRNIQTATVPQA